jgi:hypothetical protein
VARAGGDIRRGHRTEITGKVHARLRATRSFASTIKEFREAVLALAVFVAIMTMFAALDVWTGFRAAE